MLLVSFKIRLDCLLICLIFPFLSIAQKYPQASPDFAFGDIEHISSQRGFAGNEVIWITQDKSGFIWFVTDIGLVRYDGYAMRSYGYNPKDSNSITAGVYWQLSEDKNGVLWFSTSDQGLYSFDPSMEKFTRYRHKRDDINSLLSDQMGPFDLQPDGIIWHLSYEGIEKFDPQKKTFTHFYKEKNGLSNDTSFAMVVDDRKSPSGHHNLWIFNKSPGIDYFDTE